ncbi:MAG: hypothetical protein ACM4AI_23375 [Acidobacteriota bacterium]
MSVLLLAVGAGVMTHPASGQAVAQGDRQYVRLSEIRLKPEAMADWTEIQKTEAIPMEKKAGYRWRQVWSSGNEFFDRLIIEPIATLADLDGGNVAVRTIGAEASAALHARIQRTVNGVRSVIAEVRPDLGYGPPPERPRLAVLMIIDVVHGRARDFEAFLKTEAVPALKKDGTAWMSVMQVLFGDDANRYFVWTPTANYAELSKGSPLERGFGADGARVLAEKTRAMIGRVERRVVRYSNELSYINTPSASR